MLFRLPENALSSTNTNTNSNEPLSKKKLDKGPTRKMDKNGTTATNTKPNHNGNIRDASKELLSDNIFDFLDFKLLQIDQTAHEK